MAGVAWLAPAWLWGLVAVAVPIAVHLLSRGPARRVLIGSVRLLRMASSRRARRLRFTDPWLALARSLLLVAVVLALAGPYWVRGLRSPVWTLVDPGLLADPTWRPSAPDVAERLDRLAREGELRLLAAGLPRPGERRGDAQPPPGSVWSLLREAEAVAPPQTAFEVFTYGSLSELAGTRPRIAGEVRWHTARPAETSWTQRSEALADRERIRTARSTAHVTRVDRSEREVASPASSASGHRPLSVVLVADPERADDARYVTAAIEAIVRSDWLWVELMRLDPETAVPLPPSDVAIWLSPEPMPDAWQSWAREGGLVLRDAEGARFRECAGVADLPDGLGSVAIRRCPPAGAYGERVVPRWIDRQGRPFLVTRENGRVQALAGRFHPAWSDLVVSPALPRWLAALLDQVARERGLVVADGEVLDRRQADSQDRQPRPSATATPRLAGASVRGARSIEGWLWSAVAVLFVLERLLAGRRTP